MGERGANIQDQVEKKPPQRSSSQTGEKEQKVRTGRGPLLVKSGRQARRRPVRRARLHREEEAEEVRTMCATVCPQSRVFTLFFLQDPAKGGEEVASGPPCS